MRTSPEKRNPSGSKELSGAKKFGALAAALVLSAKGALLLGGCSTAQGGGEQFTPPSTTATAEASKTTPTMNETPAANSTSEATASPTPEVAESATPDIERTPLRDWKGLEMLDNLPSDPNEKTEKVFEFIMLNDPECDLTAERIAASTTWGNFTDTGEQLMKALNVVGSLYSDYTVKGNQKKADLLIDGLTSYHSPEANKKLKIFIHNTFFAAEFIDKHQPEVFNQRFNGAEITQNTDTLTAMFAEDGEPYQGYTISAKLQPAHNDLGLPGGLKEPTLHIDLNVGGVITKFEVE